MTAFKRPYSPHRAGAMLPEKPRPTRLSSTLPAGYPQAAIASDAPGCATHGRKILERNGSVIDAIITTSLCTGLVNIQSMGVGGGFFMVYYRESVNKTYVLDARETAPATASEDMFIGRPATDKVRGPLSIAVPSELKGLYAAWKRFGRLPWADLFVEAIAMCRHGVPVTPTMHAVLTSEGSSIPLGSALGKLFFNDTAGRFKDVGELIYRPKLADYLERVAAFPEGLETDELHKDVAADLSDVKAIVSLKDLVEYSPIWREPLEMPLKVGHASYVLHAPPPPSAAVLVGLAINALSGLNYTRPDNSKGPGGVLFYHRLIEVFKLIFGKRSFLSDINWMTPEVKQMVSQMQTLACAQETMLKITDYQTHDLDYYGPLFDTGNDAGTSHISIVGPGGEAVSFTSTINTVFGSAVIGERTGILFNNEMDDFSTPSEGGSSANCIQPGKRPLSAMSPLIITHAGAADNSNNSIRLVIGGSGGSQILTAVLQSTFANLNLDMNIKEAIDSSRTHHQLIPNFFRYEKDLPPHILEGLRQIGHQSVEARTLSAVQAIEVLSGVCSAAPTAAHTVGARGCLLANADFRKGGTSDGF